MGLTTRSCQLGGTTSARMKRWQLSRSTVVCVIGLPAFADGPALCRKRSTWSTPPSHCLPPTTSIEQRQNSPCYCLLNTLHYKAGTNKPYKLRSHMRVMNIMFRIILIIFLLLPLTITQSSSERLE